jgi:cell wall-associated NlpC family hydrolase
MSVPARLGFDPRAPAMIRLRPASFAVVAALLVSAASVVHAQTAKPTTRTATKSTITWGSTETTIPIIRGSTPTSLRATTPTRTATTTTTTKAKSTTTTSSTARFRAAPRTPGAGLAARGSNPSGPFARSFARLNEVQRDSIIHNSRSLLGVRYKWAGASPERGLDCSGFVQYVFKKLGIDLPHHAATLAKLGEPMSKDRSEMQVGDLLVFSKMKSTRISHVGIYVGDGMMVHASSRAKQVVEVPIDDYREKMNLRGVRRVIAIDTTGSMQESR